MTDSRDKDATEIQFFLLYIYLALDFDQSLMLIVY